MQAVRHISISINRRPAEVYEFASNPGNLPLWAGGFSGSEVLVDGNVWKGDSRHGKVGIRFAPRNVFGVMDHDFIMESGAIAHFPMRVVPNGEGCEFIFTLIRQPQMSDEDFANIQAAMEQDLKTLKGLMEWRAAS